MVTTLPLRLPGGAAPLTGLSINQASELISDAVALSVDAHTNGRERLAYALRAHGYIDEESTIPAGYVPSIVLTSRVFSVAEMRAFAEQNARGEIRLSDEQAARLRDAFVAAGRAVVRFCRAS